LAVSLDIGQFVIGRQLFQHAQLVTEFDGIEPAYLFDWQIRRVHAADLVAPAARTGEPTGGDAHDFGEDRLRHLVLADLEALADLDPMPWLFMIGSGFPVAGPALVLARRNADQFHAQRVFVCGHRCPTASR
jgi:hypothetical protein